MSLTSWIIAFANGRAAKRFEAASRTAGDTQRAKLMSLVRITRRLQP